MPSTSFFIRSVNWLTLGSAVLLVAAGLVTMNSFGEANSFFEQQVVWFLISLAVFFTASLIDWRFLRQTRTVSIIFLLSAISLALLFFLGTITLGAVSRFDFGVFFIQPSDPAKLALVIILAKYFSRRHVEIANVRHILVSGIYAFIFFVLLFLQPDFGGAMVVFALWLGMTLVSGLSKKHLGVVVLTGAIAFGGLWAFVFEDYQKDRIRTFVNPLTDIQGAGYNAYQSMVTVGSGEITGKGIGFGTQSRLKFLPEYETDFIFAAFAEEWGFIGVLIILGCFAALFGSLIFEASRGATNFETLFILGVILTLAVPAIIHIGMNVGILPVTGTVLPFMSYGGSHLVVEFLALGMIAGMRRYRRATHREALGGEVVM